MYLKEKVKNYIREKGMISPGDGLLLGVSGGADSMCLLHLMCELKEELHIRLFVVHVHHGLRGEAADGDEDFVRTACEKLKVPFKAFHIDVPAEMKRRQLSEEETGRILRYEIFEKVMKSENLNKMALAHNMNDVAETLLHNEARGTSLAGLTSLRPLRGTIIRPLLCVERSEIEAELREKGLSWREDATNHEDEHTRNRIRHHILPELTQKVNVQTVRHLFELSETASEAVDFLRETAMEKAGLYLEETKDTLLIRNELFENEKPALISEIGFMALEKLCGVRRDLSRIHLRSLFDLYEGENGRRSHLPYGLVAERTCRGLVIKKRAQGSLDENEKKACRSVKNPEGWTEEAGGIIPLAIPGTVRAGGWLITAEIEERNPSFPADIPEKTYTKWFDYDKIIRLPVLRTRHRGDRLVINAKGQHKSLSDYLTDQKIPRDERDGLWLLADGSEILWILGGRMGGGARVKNETRYVLKVTAKEAKNEREGAHSSDEGRDS